MDDTIKKLMKKYLICSDDEAIEMIYFVQDLLQHEADKIEENEPYATIDLNNIHNAIVIVDDLIEQFE
jgi:hypothetical protein